MGFTTGFTGGVTLVLGGAYLALQAHKRNRTQQIEAIRAQTYILNSLSYIPASAPKPKTVAEELALLEYQQELLAKAENRRARLVDHESFVQKAKDRWNTEIEGVVRWASTKDWTAAREDAEYTAGNLWARLTGGEPPVQPTVRARDIVTEKAAAAAATARTTTQQVTSKTREIVQTKTVETKEAATSIWERGFKKSKDAVDKAKAVVGLTEEKTSGLTSSQSEVERVLQQRYESKPDEILNKTAEEILEERYKPIKL